MIAAEQVNWNNHATMDKLKQVFSGRPLWMNGLMLFCAYMTFIYMPFDMLKPVDQDQEVWFGIMLTGWAAKATEPLHWIIYGLGCYGFFKMKSWMYPWAAVYVAQIAIAMFVWSILNENGNLRSGLIAGAMFTLLGIALFVAKDKFRGEQDT